MKQTLEKEFAASLVNGRLPCAVAFRVARKLSLAPKAVGEKANELGIRIADCQLGCFGVKKATHEDLIGKPLDNHVAGAVRASLTQGQLPCIAAYEVGKSLKVSRRRVGDTATQLKARIVDCQLGCF